MIYHWPILLQGECESTGLGQGCGVGHSQALSIQQRE